MEPRPHERGKFRVNRRAHDHGSRFNGATSSRTWKVKWRRDMQNERHVLQWSHVLTNVERRAQKRAYVGAVRASMEPRPHERGKRAFRARLYG